MVEAMPPRLSPRAPLAILVVLAAASAASAVDKAKARYMGGAVQSVPIDAEGTLATSDGERFHFVAEAGAGAVEVLFSQMLDVTYGQNLEKGVKTLFRKRREHILEISYLADPKSQAESTIMFELGKDLVFETLDSIERGTGRRVLYADAEAAKFRREQRR